MLLYAGAACARQATLAAAATAAATTRLLCCCHSTDASSDVVERTKVLFKVQHLRDCGPFAGGRKLGGTALAAQAAPPD